MKQGLILALIASTVTACLPDASLSVAFDKIQGGSTSSSSPAATAIPDKPLASALRIEAEKSVKTGGSDSLIYPVQERRSGGEEVMMFSGGDAGSHARLTLPELKGKYKITIHWLNSGDSPAMELELGALRLLLPDSNEFHTDGQLQSRDLGVHTLALEAESPLTMTVKGDVTGKGNAWIAIDYFEFTPVS